ncbi:related to GDSL lipase/acylhydrolase family protein [Cephalotrichum gorgonifer]|uniref:Related to GDSL lipase/acylhydrolase family protein n=1 Tax=Cephalotrichum gorgonifer TaxID=2041049 RepID=A0AAE8MSQ8_9PEZI|nr:related to GDSL lipase/acylhydrolase family protein [Cephalotrichum gorgonifer]
MATIATASCLKFQNLVSFGDSITDEGRLPYFVNNGELPPAGMIVPPNNKTASGGQSWPRFVAQKAGVNSLNYAIGGAVCSNELVPRYNPDFWGEEPMPAIMDNEIPTYLAELELDFYEGGRTADNTVYTLWIGTNDMGSLGYLSDQQAPGKTITDFVECNWEIFDVIYETGGRHFVLFNVFPYDQAPLYNLPERGGRPDPAFNPGKTETNMTLFYVKAQQYSTSINTMFDYGAPFQLLTENRWPGVTLTVVDIHSLMSDIIASPEGHLEAPANVTGVYTVCKDLLGLHCIDSEESKDSFMFYDDLHPSERMEEIFADEFLKALAGTSEYAKTYKSHK